MHFVRLIRRVSARILVWCLCREAENSGADLNIVRRVTNLEVEALLTAPQEVLNYHNAERRIIAARLARRYDPGMVLNEVTQRAQAKKAEAREFASHLTDAQIQALAFQQAYLKRIADAS